MFLNKQKEINDFQICFRVLLKQVNEKRRQVISHSLKFHQLPSLEAPFCEVFKNIFFGYHYVLQKLQLF